MQNSQQNKKYIAAAIIEKDNKILIAQRAKKDSLFGKWEFPGGKVEDNETLEECLKRELFEELGIYAKIGECFCTSTFYHKDSLYDMCVFKVPSFEGEIILKEHSAIAWVLPFELSKLTLTKNEFLKIINRWDELTQDQPDQIIIIQNVDGTFTLIGKFVDGREI